MSEKPIPKTLRRFLMMVADQPLKLNDFKSSNSSNISRTILGGAFKITREKSEIVAMGFNAKVKAVVSINKSNRISQQFLIELNRERKQIAKENAESYNNLSAVEKAIEKDVALLMPFADQIRDEIISRKELFGVDKSKNDIKLMTRILEKADYTTNYFWQVWKRIN